MNGLYSETGFDQGVPPQQSSEPNCGYGPDPETHQWVPGQGYKRAEEVKANMEEVHAAFEQAIALKSVEIHHDIKNRLKSFVDGMEDYADTLEQAYNAMYANAAENVIWLAALKPEHQESVLIARALKDGLIDTVRNLANSVSETYGV